MGMRAIFCMPTQIKIIWPQQRIEKLYVETKIKYLNNNKNKITQARQCTANPKTNILNSQNT